MCQEGSRRGACHSESGAGMGLRSPRQEVVAEWSHWIVWPPGNGNVLSVLCWGHSKGTGPGGSMMILQGRAEPKGTGPFCRFCVLWVYVGVRRRRGNTQYEMEERQCIDSMMHGWAGCPRAL